ncbi:hypothetical protein BP6252_13889 [Coleophoma cylindrospora]|uniref:tripeptidyl-peptidase II n=1 Tax=Coleophoma cylindrospora TaxID=1849047 RepID=A0A3D8Q6N5_9HELO|nr:hypothetical protein BP6252_13889 [Coleophoma cylindrospora]
MVGVKTFLSLAAAVQAVGASPISSRTPYAVKETHIIPRGWSEVAEAPKGQTIHLNIGVKQGQFAELERHLYEVSDPDHSRYGQHLSAEDVHDLVRPSSTALDLVHEWLADNGIQDLSYSATKDWISVSIPVDTAERLLDTKYSLYEHTDGARLVRTSKWSLPKHLHEHIDTIQPTTSFMRHLAQRTTVYTNAPPAAGYKPPSNATIAKVCNASAVTIECFRTLYSIPDDTPKATKFNKVAFTNYLDQLPLRPDAKSFLEQYRPDVDSNIADTFPQISINGGVIQPEGPGYLLPANSTYAYGEANLDVQTLLGMVSPIEVISYSTGGAPPSISTIDTPENGSEPYLVWLKYMLGLKDIPQVISTSYADEEQSVPKSYAVRACQEFAQMGARGVTLTFGSGDSGVGAPPGCFAVGTNQSTFLPAFPSSCPYVTTVGATKNFEPEVVAGWVPGDFLEGRNVTTTYSSGGGFSNYFEQPSYQSKVVNSYIKSLNGTYDGLYNKSGRAYPDLSAQGQFFSIWYQGSLSYASGTSASTPLTASIISLVNNELIAAGKPVLGFLNPFLYSKGYKAYTDVTSGSAIGCGVSGFPATKGWDAVTGFGTPKFPELVALAKKK